MRQFGRNLDCPICSKSNRWPHTDHDMKYNAVTRSHVKNLNHMKDEGRFLILKTLKVFFSDFIINFHISHTSRRRKYGSVFKAIQMFAAFFFLYIQNEIDAE